MVSKGIMIGIAIGVFFAGIGIGYAIFQSFTPVSPMMMSSQQMQQMMNDPQSMNQWHQQMMQNPQAMNQWMNTMMQNPNSMNQWMGTMMQNQQFMHGMMMNPEFQQSYMGPWMSNSTNWNHMMDSGWMNQEMMGNHMMGSGMMMGPGMMMGGVSTSPSSASVSDLQTSAEPQTRTFDVILDEVEFYAEVENEEGQEEIVLVELHQWNPNLIVVNEGDTVILNISNPRKHTHTFSIPELGINTKVLEARTGSETIQFVADKPGVFTFACGLPYNSAAGQCDPDHSMMTGTLIVLG